MATNNKSNRSTSRRGFAGMDADDQRRIASMGGKAAHQSGNAHRFDSAEAAEAGRRGGKASHSSGSSSSRSSASQSNSDNDDGSSSLNHNHDSEGRYE